MADKYGRKAVLRLSILGLALAHVFYNAVCEYGSRFLALPSRRHFENGKLLTVARLVAERVSQSFGVDVSCVQSDRRWPDRCQLDSLFYDI